MTDKTLERVHPSETRWLGRLETANHLFAVMEPIAKWVDGAWMEVEPAASAKFRINVRPSDLGAHPKTGSVWTFHTDTDHITAYKKAAVRPTRAVPAIDLSDLSLQEVRQRLTEKGIPFPDRQGRQAIVILSEGRYAEIRFEKEGRTWFARPANGLVEVYQTDGSWDWPAPVKGMRYVPADLIKGIHVETLDWTSDEEFLARVVKHYRGAIENYSKALAAHGDSPIKRFEQALAGLTGGSNAKSAEWTALATRLRDEWTGLAPKIAAIEDIGRLLLDSAEGRHLLAQAASARVKELESSMRAELELRLVELRRQVEQLRGQEGDLRSSIKSLEVQRHSEVARAAESKVAADALDAENTRAKTTLAGLETRIDAANRLVHEKELQMTSLESDSRALEDALNQSRDELVRFAQGLRTAIEFASVHEIGGLEAFSKRIGALLGNEARGEPDMLPDAIPPWWAVGTSNAQVITPHELSGRLAYQARSHGLMGADLALLDAFVRAGEPVLLLGDQAELACTAYARAVSGGNLRRFIADPSLLGIDDFWRYPATGRPTAFSLAWHHAVAHPSEAVVVCLCGVDAAPLHLWVDQLTEVLRGPQRPSNLLVVATGCAPGRKEADYEASDLVASRFVAMEARSDSPNAMAVAALEPPPDPTVLISSFSDTTDVPPREIMQIASTARRRQSLSRALRLRQKLAGLPLKDQQATALAWCNFLDSGAVVGLPEPIALGLKAVKRLHQQH